jgi:hypothetical protein
MRIVRLSDRRVAPLRPAWDIYVRITSTDERFEAHVVDSVDVSRSRRIAHRPTYGQITSVARLASLRDGLRVYDHVAYFSGFIDQITPAPTRVAVARRYHWLNPRYSIGIADDRAEWVAEAGTELTHEAALARATLVAGQFGLRLVDYGAEKGAA